MEFFRQLLNEGGPIVYVILVFMLIALIIFAERFLVMLRCRIDTYALLGGLIRQLKNGNIKVAVANCDAGTGPIGEVFRAAIEHWGDGEAAIRFAIEETARLAIGRLEKRMKLLSAIASISPLLGLLGTLCQMIKVFGEIKSNGGEFVGTLQLSGFISSALIATAVGIVTSLVAYLCYIFLVERLDDIVREMNKGAAEITYFLTANPMER